MSGHCRSLNRLAVPIGRQDPAIVNQRGHISCCRFYFGKDLPHLGMPTMPPANRFEFALRLFDISERQPIFGRFEVKQFAPFQWLRSHSQMHLHPMSISGRLSARMECFPVSKIPTSGRIAIRFGQESHGMDDANREAAAACAVENLEQATGISRGHNFGVS